MRGLLVSSNDSEARDKKRRGRLTDPWGAMGSGRRRRLCAVTLLGVGCASAFSPDLLKIGKTTQNRPSRPTTLSSPSLLRPNTTPAQQCAIFRIRMSSRALALSEENRNDSPSSSSDIVPSTSDGSDSTSTSSSTSSSAATTAPPTLELLSTFRTKCMFILGLIKAPKLDWLNIVVVLVSPLLLLSAYARSVGLPWQPFLAGGISCALSHGMATPFDVVKTRMQTNPELYDGSVAAAFRRIARNEGPAFLWQGLGPTVVGYAMEGALKIGVYELLKPMLRTGILRHFPAAASFVAAGCLSGVVASVVLCPAEDIRIRSVADPDYAKGGSILSAFMRLCREEGLLGAYSGFWAMNAKQVPYTISKQCSFDYITTIAYVALSDRAWACSATSKVAVPLFAATLAAILSCVASQPGDVLLTATYKDSEHTHGAIGEVWESGGVRALFTGIKARLLHVISTVTVQLFAYDFLKRLLGMGATGLS